MDAEERTKLTKLIEHIERNKQLYQEVLALRNRSIEQAELLKRAIASHQDANIVIEQQALRIRELEGITDDQGDDSTPEAARSDEGAVDPQVGSDRDP